MEPSRPPLERRAPHIGFDQLVRLLAARTPEASAPGAAFEPGAERIRFRADAAMVFPPGDVRALDLDGETATVTPGFGGLYGIDGALPAAFHDHLSRRPDETAALRAFLDLFDQRLYAMRWRAGARAHPEWHPEGGPAHARWTHRLHALTGTVTPDAAPAPISDTLRLAFAGMLASWARHAEGLQRLLEAALELPVAVEENVVRRVALPERPPVGRARLGRDTVIGARVLDASGRFRLVLGPMPRARFLDLLPGAPGAARLDALVRLYAPDHLDYEVVLLLDAADVPATRLGDREARLGRLACLGRPRATLRRTVHSTS